MSFAPPVLASRVVASTAGVPDLTGAGLLESAADLVRGVQSRNWVEAGLGGLSVSLDAFSATIDPVGTVAAWGFSWLIEHVQPLTAALDQLAGDSVQTQIETYVHTWEGVARALRGEQEGLSDSVRRLARQWTGSAGTAARRFGEQHRDLLAAAAQAAQGVAAVVGGSAVLVAVVRGLVRDLIAQCLATLAVRVPSWIAATGLSLGSAAPVVVAQAQAVIAQCAKKIASLIRSLTTSLKRLGGYITRLGALINDIRAAIRRVGRPAGAARSAAAAIPAPRVAREPMKTLTMQMKYQGESWPNNKVFGSRVRYLSAREREQYRLFVRDGKLYDMTGKPFDTNVNDSIAAIYVMDKDGNLYASNFAQKGKFHHSSFFAGQPVAGAGVIRVVDGRVDFINNNSGHYKPPPEYLTRVVETLKQQGVEVGRIQRLYR